MSTFKTKKSFGIIGGLGALAGADVFFKLQKSFPQYANRNDYEFIYEQRGFEINSNAGAKDSSQNSRKIYIFDRIKDFEKRNVTCVILPCFISHTFLHELQAEIKLPILDLMKAIYKHTVTQFPDIKNVGVLTSDYVRKNGLFEKYFKPSEHTLIYPSNEYQSKLMNSIYASNGIQAGHLQGDSITAIESTCRHLLENGAEVILPGFTEIGLVASQLKNLGIPIIDCNSVYANYAFDEDSLVLQSSFKIGIVGGVGPAATVDFMNKIIKNTSAKHDQEHIKLIVEHNPQIPDRTENLIAEGADPTVALYSTCKKLESNDANLIAIPCNTAHAFVERIQPYLAIPIINMLQETANLIATQYKSQNPIGLLATTGTIKSKVYHEILNKAGLSVICPDELHQQLVMSSIYGKTGVKAGFTSGQCREDLQKAMKYLVQQGAKLLILGCTELPIIQAQTENAEIDGKKITILDPTEILAKKCVNLANQQLTSKIK